MFSVRFWGVRGSVACPSEKTLRFGGNTSCLEIRAGKRLIIIDMGTGIHPLGISLIEQSAKSGPVDADIFITHTHLDHLAGFQMFVPLFIPSSKLRIHGPFMTGGITLRSVFSQFMAYPFWPVRLDELPAELSFQDLGETTLDLGGGLCVRTKYLNHPVICLGYRFEYEGKTIVTSYDNEPFWNIFGPYADADFLCADAARAGEKACKEENEKLRAFYHGADVLIYDCQYTEDEYKNGKYHWGHSSYQHAVETAQAAGVKKLLLFHHDPSRSDDYLDALEQETKTKYHPHNGLEIIVCREGMVVET